MISRKYLDRSQQPVCDTLGSLLIHARSRALRPRGAYCIWDSLSLQNPYIIFCLLSWFLGQLRNKWHSQLSSVSNQRTPPWKNIVYAKIFSLAPSNMQAKIKGEKSAISFKQGLRFFFFVIKMNVKLIVFRCIQLNVIHRCFLKWEANL